VTEHRKSHYRKIGCATRGGDASRSTEDKAIALAREHSAELVFLYIVDTSFAGGLTGKFDIDMVAHELGKIGEIVLEQAKARAKEKGVIAQDELRTGAVADEIRSFVDGHEDLDMLVVGHMSVELHRHLDPVLQEMAEHHVDVLVVRPD